MRDWYAEIMAYTFNGLDELSINRSSVGFIANLTENTQIKDDSMKNPVQILTTYNNSLTTYNYVNHVCPIGNNDITNMTSSIIGLSREEPLIFNRESGIETAAEVRP